ncbi:MAG: DUF3187 family protein [Planctomycetes bacterium]|nr:DUF3187 family protein [Planctomycetota bacterium]
MQGLTILLAVCLLAGTAAAETIDERAERIKARRGELVVPFFGDQPDPAKVRQWGLGPADPRDPWPLALLHSTIPVETPETTPRGEFRRIGTQFVWANSSFIGFRPGREFVIDAEVMQLQLQARYGITDDFEAGLELPLIYVGGGYLDNTVERFHLLIGSEGQRRQYLGHNDYKVFVSSTRGTTSFERDFGLGDLSAFAKYRFLDGGTWLPAASASVRLKAPTASTTNLGRQGWDLSLELQVSKRIGPVVAMGGGGLWGTTDGRYQDVRFMHYAAQGWLGLEVGIVPGLSLEVHSTVRTTLLDETADLGAGRYYIVGSIRYRKAVLGADVETWFGVLENFSEQMNTADIGFILGFEVRF